MTYACSAWEFVTDTHLLKLQHLQNKVLCTTGKFSSCTPVCELDMAFQVPYTGRFFTLLTGSTTLCFTVTGAPLAMSRIQILLMNQHA
jgi:hypothetical protein